MPINNRVMPDCIVITARNTREPYSCAEGLTWLTSTRRRWNSGSGRFRERLYTGDLPVYKRGDGHLG